MTDGYPAGQGPPPDAVMIAGRQGGKTQISSDLFTYEVLVKAHGKEVAAEIMQMIHRDRDHDGGECDCDDS